MNFRFREDREMTMRRTAFTLVELLVVISIIALLIAILIPSLKKARDQAKKTVCQSNQHQLMIAWMQYSSEYGDRIINGETGTRRQYDDPALPGATLPATGEDGWVGFDGNWDPEFDGLIPLPQTDDIEVGAMFPYTKNPDLYRCPTVLEGIRRNYSIVDRMNGWDPGFRSGGPGSPDPLIIRYTSRIRGPSEQIVLLDDGQQTYSTWTAYKDQDVWQEPITTRHLDGSTFSFADGHVEHWRWTHPDTKKVGSLTIYDYLRTTRGRWYYPVQGGPNPDLRRIQRGIWGKAAIRPS